MYEKSDKRWQPAASVKLPPLEREGFESSVLERNRWKKAGAAKAKAAAMPDVCLLREDTGEKFQICKIRTIIGKGENADIVITGNNTISRVHAEITFDGDAFFIRDLKSLNHTYVNGEMITGKTEFTYGYTITLAEENFIFMD